MRILKYYNEHKIQCPHCKTLLAYNQDDFNEMIDDYDYVNDVKTYLSRLDNYELQQLTQTQIKTLKEHPDYFCNTNYKQIFLKCPRCGEKIKLYNKLIYLEIYPQDYKVAYGSVDITNLKYWNKFNEVKL